jgi:hypothetical protein
VYFCTKILAEGFEHFIIFPRAAANVKSLGGFPSMSTIKANAK